MRSDLGRSVFIIGFLWAVTTENLEGLSVVDAPGLFKFHNKQT